MLLACLDARDALLARMDRVHAFAGLHEAGDGGNAAHQADLSSAAAVMRACKAALKFVDNEILALPEATLAAYLRDEPELSVYRPTLDELAALRPHMLSPETERVLASLGEVLELPATQSTAGRGTERACSSRRVHRYRRHLASEFIQPLSVDLRS